MYWLLMAIKTLWQMSELPQIKNVSHCQPPSIQDYLLWNNDYLIFLFLKYMGGMLIPSGKHHVKVGVLLLTEVVFMKVLVHISFMLYIGKRLSSHVINYLLSYPTSL